MSFSDILRNGLLELVLNRKDLSGIATASGDVDFYVHLHDGSPGSGGTSLINEVTYPGYTDQEVDRDQTTPFWTVTGNTAVPSSPIVFPKCTGASTDDADHASLCRSDGSIVLFGSLVRVIEIRLGVVPKVNALTEITLV